jgi:hypothetical protein
MLQRNLHLPRQSGLLTHVIRIILWRIGSLLGNDSVNIFPRVPTRAIGRPLLGNESIKKPKTIRDNRRRCFPWGPPWGYIMEVPREQSVIVRSWETSVEEEFELLLSRIRSRSGDGSRRWLGRNGKKLIRLSKEDFMCDLKLQWNNYKS